MEKISNDLFAKFVDFQIENVTTLNGGTNYGTTGSGTNNAGCADAIDTETDNGWKMNGNAVDYYKDCCPNKEGYQSNLDMC